MRTVKGLVRLPVLFFDYSERDVNSEVLDQITYAQAEETNHWSPHM